MKFLSSASFWQRFSIGALWPCCFDLLVLIFLVAVGLSKCMLNLTEVLFIYSSMSDLIFFWTFAHSEQPLTFFVPRLPHFSTQNEDFHS